MDLQAISFVQLLFEKHGLSYDYSSDSLTNIRNSLIESNVEKIGSLIDEVVRTGNDLRSRIQPKYRFDDRYEDFKKCLLLDGFSVTGSKLVSLEPSITGSLALEDDLTNELKNSGLADSDSIVQKLADSAEAFRQSEPDLNASLNNARVALQTLATSIAKARPAIEPGTFDERKWGSVLAYLRATNFVTEDEEKGLSGIFGFVSPGSHVPLGLTKLEMARLGRSFIMGSCWFLIKHYRNSAGSS
ncbi:MAG: hypothetical protein ACXWKG_00365 [Limisphaerales bacterium]